MKKLCSLAVAALCTTAALPAFATLRQVTGTLSFQDAMPGNTYAATRPVRSVSVKLKVAGSQVGSATTNSAGTYSVWIDDSKLPVGQPLSLEYQSRNYASTVKLDLDWYDDSLLWTQSTTIPSGTGPIVHGDTVFISEFSQHFSILDAIQYGRQYVDARREGGDDVGTAEVQYPDADWTNYSSFWNEITVAGPSAHGYGGNSTDHGWSDAVILHEYGHHLEYHISDVDTGGGDHTTCDDKGYGFGWAEGWATFYAGAVRSVYPNVIGSFGNLENTPGCASPGAEAFTTSVLWDMLDGAGTEAHDRMSGATVTYSGKSVADMMFGVFDTEQDDLVYYGSTPYDPTTSILGFHNHMVARNPYYGAHADMDRIYAAHKMFPHALSDFSVPSITPSPSGNVIAGKNVNLTITLANPGVAYTDEHLLVRVTTWPSGGSEIELDSFVVLPFTGNKTMTRSVTMPSTLAEGTAFVFVYVDPMDRFLETVENNNVLAIAVPIVRCGNGVCSAGESCSTCAQDCGSCCGNGSCSGTETCQSCSADCGSCGGCGDGWCVGTETAANCPDDCGIELPPCFAAGTPITMADGTTKPIEEVVAGDRVLSYDPERGQLVTGEVSNTLVHPESERLVVINGSLVTTSAHRFYVDGAWVAAEDLDAGSPLLSIATATDAGAALSTVSSSVRQIEAREGRITTYNFEVAGWHDYFAGGVLVHNIKKDTDF